MNRASFQRETEREREEIEREAGGVHGLEPIKIQVELEQ